MRRMRHIISTEPGVAARSEWVLRNTVGWRRRDSRSIPDSFPKVEWPVLEQDVAQVAHFGLAVFQAGEKSGKASGVLLLRYTTQIGPSAID